MPEDFKFNIPKQPTIQIDLGVITPAALAVLRDGLDAALHMSTEEEETKQLEKALSQVEEALLTLRGSSGG